MIIEYWIGVAVSSNWNITPAQMADCWEAHSLNKNLSSLNEHSYPGFHSLIVKDLDYNKTSSTSAVTHVPRPKRDNSSQSSSSSALVTPAHTKRYQQQSNSASSEADRNDSGHRRISLSPGEMATTNPSPFAPQPPVYDERKNSGEVIFTFNPSKLAQRKIPEASHGPRCRILHGDPGDENDAVFSKSPNVTAPYRHYFTVLDERALALDRQLQATQDLFVERYNFGSSSMEEDHHASTSLEAVGVPRQEKICCIGRICNSVRDLCVGSQQFSNVHPTVPLYFPPAATHHFFTKIHFLCTSLGARRSHESDIYSLRRIAPCVGRRTSRTGFVGTQQKRGTVLFVSGSNCGGRRGQHIRS